MEPGLSWDDNGPNCNFILADDVNGCEAIQASVGGDQSLAALGMPCSGGFNLPSQQQTARSLHPNGVNVALCDGSVRWITNFIESNGTLTRLSIWDRLNASSDGLPANAEEN